MKGPTRRDGSSTATSRCVARPPAEERRAGGTRCGPATVRAYPWRHDPGAGPAGRAEQQRFRLGPIYGWWHDALRQQRNRTLARLGAEARALVRTDAHHPAASVAAGRSSSTACEVFRYEAECLFRLRMTSRGQYPRAEWQLVAPSGTRPAVRIRRRTGRS